MTLEIADLHMMDSIWGTFDFDWVPSTSHGQGIATKLQRMGLAEDVGEYGLWAVRLTDKGQRTLLAAKMFGQLDKD